MKALFINGSPVYLSYPTGQLRSFVERLNSVNVWRKRRGINKMIDLEIAID